MTNYSQSQPNFGDPKFAKNIILQTLLPLGFEIISESSYALTVKGPGYNSTRQNPLLGISQATFDFGRSNISVDAQLGGVNRMARFLLILLIGVAVFDAAVFFGLWYTIDTLNEHNWFLFIPALTLFPWIFIGPWMTKWIRRRCEDAIGTLLRNATSHDA